MSSEATKKHPIVRPMLRGGGVLGGPEEPSFHVL